MSLRDEIKAAIQSNIDYREGVAYEGEVAWREGWWEWDKAADAIITLFREALTSHASLDAAVDGYLSADPDVPRDYGDMERAITAALDAVTGEGDR